MKKQFIRSWGLSLCLLSAPVALMGNPIHKLLERIDKGASRKFHIEIVSENDSTDYFELDQKGSKISIKGNNYVSVATGLNWYLKYHAGIHLSWNGMQADLPDTLPPVRMKERRSTNLKERYNFNYCTFSYTMAFWDWPRWEQEIDWMALHGITTPLALTGTETVWRNMLLKLGYTKDEINEFIAGPGFQAWWLMNNLEGWGGPNPDSWYKQQEELQQKIIKRMTDYGIKPVLAGYSGMVPSNVKEKLGLDVTDPGTWCSYRRPAFLQPSDPSFDKIADLYYNEMTALYGKASYYAIDPFHEGGNTKGVDLQAAGNAFIEALKRCNPTAKWIIQAWQANPRPQMIDSLKQGDLLVLDLASETRPQWGDPKSSWYRKKGYGQHDWIYCMLLNFGGNVGMYGKLSHVINSFYQAKSHPQAGTTLKGVGLTYEGSENNTIMYELVTELPWRAEKFTKDQWIKDYVFARYGTQNPDIVRAWQILANSIYNDKPQSTQEGTNESIFCARPGENLFNVSSWAWCEQYFSPYEVIEAARLLLKHADTFRGNNNFEYDLVDVLRQAIAEKGRIKYKKMMAALHTADKERFKTASEDFLQTLLLQDELLSTRKEFMVGSWINRARSLGNTSDEKDLYEWNARVQITTWGNRTAANEGGLRDYAHKEWSGLLKDFYYMRWKCFVDYNLQNLENYQMTDMTHETLKPVTPADQQNNFDPGAIDFYALEEKWVTDKKTYPVTPVSEVMPTAKRIYNTLFEN